MLEPKPGDQFKPHLFDAPDPNEVKRKKRKRKTRISRNMEPLRGILPLRVRCGYRLNEGTLLPTIRNNLTDAKIRKLNS